MSLADDFQQRRNTVGRDRMSKNKDDREVVPAKEKKGQNKDEDWKELCKDCEILKLYNDCTFGCELVKKSLKRIPKKKSR